jgi:hypothetical protein
MPPNKRTQQGTGHSRSHASTDPHPFYGSSGITTGPPSRVARYHTWISEDPIDPRSREPTPSRADSDLREAIELSVHLALDMLNTRKGRDFLDQVGSKAIKQWKPTQYVYRGPLAEMGNCVKAFLIQLQTEFVPICLMATQPAIAEFRMASWYTKGAREVAQWNPRSAGTLCLSRMVRILSILSQLLATSLPLKLTAHLSPRLSRYCPTPRNELHWKPKKTKIAACSA